MFYDIFCAILAVLTANSFMKRGSTLFLRAAILIIGGVVLAFCIFGLPSMWKGGDNPQVTSTIRLMVIVTYITALPFYFALSQGWKLLNAIDRNTAFSEASVHALRRIKYSATMISVMHIASMPFFFAFAEADDAPGVILIGGAIFIGAPLVIAVFAAVLEKLLQNAIDIKSENELTV